VGVEGGGDCVALLGGSGGGWVIYPGFVDVYNGLWFNNIEGVWFSWEGIQVLHGPGIYNTDSVEQPPQFLHTITPTQRTILYLECLLQ
jgi:hypothetical protein